VFVTFVIMSFMVFAFVFMVFAFVFMVVPFVFMVVCFVFMVVCFCSMVVPFVVATRFTVAGTQDKQSEDSHKDKFLHDDINSLLLMIRKSEFL
jgi:polyferredoxin